jgi:excisionase family DNA binding protein
MRQYIDIKKLSAKLDVKPMTIYGWVHDGLIPCRWFGRLVRFDVAEIEVWEAQRPKVSPRRGKITPINLD